MWYYLNLDVGGSAFVIGNKASIQLKGVFGQMRVLNEIWDTFRILQLFHGSEMLWPFQFSTDDIWNCGELNRYYGLWAWIPAFTGKTTRVVCWQKLCRNGILDIFQTKGLLNVRWKRHKWLIPRVYIWLYALIFLNCGILNGLWGLKYNRYRFDRERVCCEVDKRNAWFFSPASFCQTTQGTLRTIVVVESWPFSAVFQVAPAPFLELRRTGCHA